MKPGRAVSLLTGVALLGGIAKFNEMTPAAQASFLDDAAATARETAQSWFSVAVTAYDQMMGPAAAQQASIPAAPQPPAASKAGESPRRTAAADAEPPQTGNPLWSLPLKQLSMTRDRPIFSPSRRPPPPPLPAYVAPVAVRAPVKPAEPERPAVSLLGTIIGASTDDQIGVFLDSATQSVIRLRVGEDHQGWVLRLLKAREATLVKSGEEAVVVQLATPGDAPLPGLPGGPGAPAVGVPNLPPNYQAAVPGGGLPAPQQRNRRQR
jgi:general secretion pathway protein N